MSEQVVEVLRAHPPRDRYDGDGASVGTYCTCGGWEGDYFADGEAGPFDAHLAEALDPLIVERELAAAERALREAADSLYTFDNPPPTPSLRDKVAWYASPRPASEGERFAKWLRERADTYRAKENA